MRTIWKFTIPALDDDQSVAMPAGAEILSVKMVEHMAVALWALVDSTAKPVKRLIAARGTGHQCPYSQEEHLATVFDPHGFVWHIFDLGEV